MTDDFTKQQAAMYSWIRRQLTAEMFQHLTGQTGFKQLTQLEIDKALSDAFARYQAATALSDVMQRSKLRSQILPDHLGEAILSFGNACIDVGLDMASGGPEYEASEAARVLAFNKLCEAISEIR